MKTKLTQIITIIVCIAVLLIGCGSNNAQAVEQYNLGMQYLTESKYEEAVLTFTKAIEIDEKYAEAYIGRADAYIGLGGSENIANAVKDYVTASDIYIEQNNPEKAEEVLNGALDKVGDNEEIKDKLDQMQNGNSENTNSSSNSDTTIENKEKLEDEYYSDGTLKVKYEYDENGNLVKEIWYTKTGDLDFYWIREYDSKGNCIKANRYSPDDNLIYYVEHTVDENNNTIRSDFYNPDGSRQDGYWTYEYNEKNEHIKQTWYKSEGVVDYYFVPEYDDNENLIKIAYYSVNDDLIKEENYNKNGDIERKDYFNEGLLSSVEVYEYDENDNLLKCLTYTSDLSLNGELILFSSEEYFENGNIFRRISQNGALCIIVEYDENGNEVLYEEKSAIEMRDQFPVFSE